jgi:hypothetical protein
MVETIEKAVQIAAFWAEELGEFIYRLWNGG